MIQHILPDGHKPRRRTLLVLSNYSRTGIEYGHKYSAELHCVLKYSHELRDDKIVTKQLPNLEVCGRIQV
jgi:hypothetical protein